MPSAFEPVRETVPELLRGAWRRSSIRFADGTSDETSTVIWLQTASAMADLRLTPAHVALGARLSLGACSADDLRVLAGSDSSTGHTTCSPIDVDGDGVRRAVATWPDGADDITCQPVSPFPEPGLLEWDDTGDLMTECAPSGAYVEVWHRIADTDDPLDSGIAADGSHRFVAGSIAMLVRDRTCEVTGDRRIDDRLSELSRQEAERLVDCEFSVGIRGEGGSYVITASTLPWRAGEEFRVDLR